MAKETNLSYRDLIFYQIFVRQFSNEHNFQGVINKLDYLKSLNVDVIQFLPIHSIGKEHRKGSIGSPYSIKNYYSINEDYGTLEDFKLVISECHKRGIKVVLDMVFNHTSHDADYTKSHPEWYYHKENGDFCNRVGDWWDIVDFKFDNNNDLKKELINVLCYWVKLGVDGFRCDVAPLIPMEFWQEAKTKIKEINNNVLLISESVHLGFIKYLRDLGYDAYSDSEMYQVFDICYDYDIYDDLINYFKGTSPLCKWIDGIIRQESTYPKNYVKLRYLENHDMDRINLNCKNKNQLLNVTCMQFFLKGAPFIYNGQECGAVKRPDLFEYDEIDWSKLDDDLLFIIKKMTKLRKSQPFISGVMDIKEINKDLVRITYQYKNITYTGYFYFGLEKVSVNDQGLSYLEEKNIQKNEDITSFPVIIIK